MQIQTKFTYGYMDLDHLLSFPLITLYLSLLISLSLSLSLSLSSLKSNNIIERELN
jgi:hypothetical protein